MKNKTKTPTIMISRQNDDFLAFFSEQVSIFSEAISLLLIALAVWIFQQMTTITRTSTPSHTFTIYVLLFS